MQFFTSAVSTLQTLVMALGAGLAVWGVINLLEGYGSDNPGARMHSVHKEATT
ncbi:Maff2 family mobile element protein [Lacrimispora sp.]|uniref:Maff2 family mobile element protein n=1 Tax=Lacrimispora sp. TaxID=2719234 RepID=UPI003FA5F403